MEQKFRRPLSTVRPLPPWMPTPAAITMIEIILAGEATREEAATETLGARVAEAKLLLIKAFTLEKVHSV